MRVAKYAVVATAVTVALSACGSSQRTYDVSGEVTGKQIEEECTTSHAMAVAARPTPRHTPSPHRNCHTEYEILVRGEQDDVDVTREHYDRCSVGERFPSCTGNGQ